MLAKQQAAGIAAPRLLPEAQREAVAASLEFNPQAPRARVETLNGLKQAYGRWYPDLLREIAPKLDGHARVLVNMAPEAAQRLDQALAQKSDLDKAVPGQSKTDITRRTETELADLASSLSDNSDAESRVAEYVEAVELLAKSYTLRGMNPNQAAKMAAEQVLASYQFVSQGGRKPTLRVPATVDADSVAYGADAMRAKLIKEGGFIVEVDGFSDAKTAEADMAALIRRDGYWVTNEDSSGLVLRIPHRSGLGGVIRSDGSRVEYLWQELSSVQRPPPTGQFGDHQASMAEIMGR